MKKNIFLAAILLGIFVSVFSGAKIDVKAGYNEVTLNTLDDTIQYGDFYGYYCPSESESRESNNVLTVIGGIVNIEGIEEMWNKGTDNALMEISGVSAVGDTFFEVWHYVEDAINEDKTVEEALKGYAVKKIEELSPIHMIQNKVTEIGQQMEEAGETLSESMSSLIAKSKEQEKVAEEYFANHPDQKAEIDGIVEQKYGVSTDATTDVDDAGYADLMQDGKQPDFEKYGLKINVDSWNEYDYYTRCYDDPNFETKGRIVFTSERDYSADYLPAKEGYEWVRVEVVAVFGDDNAWNYGVSTASCFEDYYNIKFHDDSLKDVVIDNTTFKQYSVISDGVAYTDCLRYTPEGQWSGWMEREITYTLSAYYRVPVGYDGIVVGFRNAKIEWPEGSYVYDIDNRNTLFYRVP